MDLCYDQFMNQQKLPKLSVIIPSFNEAKTLPKVIKQTTISWPAIEIIVVDDGSTDQTQKLLKSLKLPNLKCLRHSKNLGKGSSIQTALNQATGEYIIIQDADLEYDPKEYPILLKPLTDGYADVVYGSRFIGANPHRILFFWHTLGNRLLTLISNIFTNLNLTDMETGFKAFRRSIFDHFSLKERRFGFEPEITAKIAKIPGIRIYEVGISYYGRTYQEGKKINWHDGLAAIWCIIKYNILN